MRDGSPKSVVRSIRISKEMDDLIRRDAKESGGTVNALISSILSKYAEWDRMAERLGFVSVPRDGFRALVEGVEEEKLLEIADAFGLPKSREMALLWFKRVNLETFLRYLSIQSRYGGLAGFEAERGGQEDTIALHHDLGPKYSLLLSRFIENALESIADVSPQLSVEDNALAIHLPAGTLSGSEVPQE